MGESTSVPLTFPPPPLTPPARHLRSLWRPRWLLQRLLRADHGRDQPSPPVAHLHTRRELDHTCQLLVEQWYLRAEQGQFASCLMTAWWTRANVAAGALGVVHGQCQLQLPRPGCDRDL